MAPAIGTTPSGRRVTPRLVALLAIGLAAVVSLGMMFFGASSAAHADTPAATDSGLGWVRVGHLSPDTKAVDVRLTSFSGGQVVQELDGVTYGQVSPYKELPNGRYIVSMTASGASASAKPVITKTITVATGNPISVVAYGPNKHLRTAVFQDDLSTPAAGQAKIRLFQAATVTKSVTVKTTTGTTIAKDATFGSASGYASVGSGAWKLDLTSKKITSTASVDLASGSTNTLFVLDNASGGITIVPVLDSAATTTAPVGGVQTGGGGTAKEKTSSAALPISTFTSWGDLH